MKKLLGFVAFVGLAGLACSFGTPPPAAPACAPCPPTGTPVVITQAAPAEAQNTRVLIEAEGKSSQQINTEIQEYLVRAGWESLDATGGVLVMGAPTGLDLREPGLAYRLSFDNTGPRYLAIVETQLSFVPEKVGEAFDEKLLFNAIERDFPALSIRGEMSFNSQYIFQGAYPFYVRLDVVDFVGWMDFYAYSMDLLLYKHPFFSK